MNARATLPNGRTVKSNGGGSCVNIFLGPSVYILLSVFLNTIKYIDNNMKHFKNAIRNLGYGVY
jgi:hypothetical protein